MWKQLVFKNGHYGDSITAKMLLCCHGDRSCRQWGFVFLWLSFILSHWLRRNSPFAFFFIAHPLPPLPSLTPASTAHFPPELITIPLDHLLRLGQPLQPHPSQPVRRLGGPAGPSPAGGAGQDDAHVPVEGGHGAGLAGGCHGDAHVHPQLLGERQEREGRPESPSDAGGAAAAAKSLVVLQVLLGLTDEDLELGLGVSSLMHRRKLRLAIEDYRDAESSGGWGAETGGAMPPSSGYFSNYK